MEKKKPFNNIDNKIVTSKDDNWRVHLHLNENDTQTYQWHRMPGKGWQLWWQKMPV